MLSRRILTPVGFAATTLVVLGALSVRPADSWATQAVVASVRATHGLWALHGATWFIASGKLADKKATGILYDSEGLICTGTQVEKAECILSAAHCQTKTRWAAHDRGEWELGLPIDPPFVSAPIVSVTALGPGSTTAPYQQAQDLAIFKRERNEKLPGELSKLDLRPPSPAGKKDRIWSLFGRGPTELDGNPRAKVWEAWMAESVLHDDAEFGPGNGAYYDVVPWDNGDGGPDSACGGDSGGPSFWGQSLRGVISGGADDSFGSSFTSLACGSATSNQVAATSLNGNGDFLTFAIAKECCVCIPPERSPFCHMELTPDGKRFEYACWNGAKCNVKGARPKDPDGNNTPLCHHEGCFDELTGKVFEVPTGAACGGGGGKPPPSPPGDPVPPPEPPDPVPPPPPGKGGHGHR